MKSSKKAMEVAAAGAAAAAKHGVVTVKQDSTTTPPSSQFSQQIIASNGGQPAPCKTSIVSDKVQSVAILGLIRNVDVKTLKTTLTLPSFKIRVVRSNYVHSITRRYEDFILLHNQMKAQLPYLASQLLPLPLPIDNHATETSLWDTETFEARVLEQARELNHYLQHFFNMGKEISQIVECEGVVRFLAPRNDEELDTTKMMKPRILNTSEMTDVGGGNGGGASNNGPQQRRRSSILRDFLQATGLDGNGRSKAIKT